MLTHVPLASPRTFLSYSSSEPAILGDLYMWGANAHGLIPGAPRGAVDRPHEVVAFRGTAFRSVAFSDRRAGAQARGAEPAARASAEQFHCRSSRG